MKLNQLKVNRDVSWDDVKLYERYAILIKQNGVDYAKSWKNMLPAAQQFSIEKIVVDLSLEIKGRQK